MVESWVELLRERIPNSRVDAFMQGDTRLGGIVRFDGATRAEIEPVHGRLIHLDYESYEAMALRKMHELAAEAANRWHVERTLLLHRLGRVPPGEVSVCIAVATVHRAEAFEACRWLIDSLKSEVPIWKKDVFEDGFTRWVEASKNREGKTSEPEE
jgi:molybdopterin synthase catalytic subunit